jgi:hypothetical protein
VRGARGALLAFLGLVTLGCDGSSPDVAERRRIVAAVDAVRDAPSQDSVRRRKLLEGLEREAATVPAAVLARDACAAAYRPLVDGNDLADGVQRALARGSAPDPSLEGDLREAEAAVARSRAAMPACEQALDALRHPPRG